MTRPSSSATPTTTAPATTAPAPTGDHAGPAGTDLVTAHGSTTIADTVVEKIAGLAARDVRGVHDLGGAASRALGAVRERIPGARRSLGQGVSVEVGERQAAVDLDIIVEYGAAIGEVSQAVRRDVIAAIEQMAALEVTEVNIAVTNVHIPGEDDDEAAKPARVL